MSARGSRRITDIAEAAYRVSSDEAAGLRALLLFQEHLGVAAEPSHLADAALTLLRSVAAPDAAVVYFTDADATMRPVRSFGFAGCPPPSDGTADGPPASAYAPSCPPPLPPDDDPAVRWGDTADASSVTQLDRPDGLAAFSRAALAAGFRRWVVVPLRGRVGWLGAVAGCWHAPGRPSADVQLLLEISGRMLVGTLERGHGDVLVRERVAREQFDAILGGVADGVIVQREDGTVIFANEAAARIAGFGTVAAYMEATAMQTSQNLSVLDVDGQPFGLDQLPARRAFRGEPAPDMVIQFRRAGTNELRWSRSQARIVRGATGEPLAISIFHDITDEVRSRDRLQFLAEAGAQLAGSLDMKRTLDALVGVASSTLADWAVILLIDEEGAVQHIASAHRDPAKTALAGDLHERQLRHARNAKLLWQAIQQREPVLVPVVTDEILVAGARNTEHLALLRALEVSSLLYAPLVHSESVHGAIALFMAGSGRRFGDEDRAIAVEISRRTSLALENARLYEETNAAVQARDEFLSIASHELRTPVTAISGIAQVALRSKQRGTLDDARLTRVLEQLIRGSQRLVTLTEDLLDVSRLQTGRFELRLECLDLSAFVADFVDRFSANLGERHRLTLRLKDGSLTVQADPARVEQVLANLLSNAVKYSPDGGEIAVSVTKDDAQATVAVQDEGIGLPPGTTEMIFQPFGRAPNAAHRQIQGLGLGLYICRQIAERHGGGIRAESAGDAAGTTMRMWLPLASGQG